MQAYIFDWLFMLMRWLHVITAIAWIGASFYFVWLDNSLEIPVDADLKAKGVGGELWAVHGGGFYNPQKYLGAPPIMPENLHWFYWESYSTWMSGFGLFFLIYLLNPKAYIIDSSVYPLTAAQAVSASLGFLVAGWLVYDLICRCLGFANKKVGIAVAAFIGAATFAACHLFAGRAAFLIIGAMMATIMSANVLFWIIPGQRTVIRAMKAGEPIDPVYGKRGKQRSVHNTYFTLPVLFCMLSNHFGRLSTHPSNWLVLILMMIAAVLIREFFILRHKGYVNLWYPASGLAILALVFLWVQPPLDAASTSTASISTEQMLVITQQRCQGCHASVPTLMGGGPPKGIVLESVADLERHATGIYNQVVEMKAMPLGNITQITEGERQQIAAWYAQLQTL